MVETQSPLRQLRRALEPRFPQYRLAEAAGISVQWLNCLENNPSQSTSYTTANSLLRALNVERQARGLSVLVLDDLSLKVV